MTPIQEWNELVKKLIVQLNQSIELSKQAAGKLQEIMTRYKLVDSNE